MTRLRKTGIQSLHSHLRLDLDEPLPGGANAGDQPPRRNFLRPKSAAGKRRTVMRRLALLGAAIAVPAMAAPSFEQSAPEGQTIRFLLAEVPDSARVALAPATEPHPLPLAAPPAMPTDIPAAAALRIGGSLTDRARAQQCLAMAVYYEAASEPLDGQRAVAQVVLNRVAHSAYPNTVCGVVFQGSERTTGCQFSFTCDGSLARRPQTASLMRAEQVARAALGGYVYRQVGTATHYHATYVDPHWASSLDPVGLIGLHLFYRWKGAPGLPRAFTANYAGGEPLPRRNYSQARYSAPQVAAAEAAPAAISRSIEAPGAVILQAAAIASTSAPARQPVVSLAGHERSGEVRAEFSRSGEWLARP